MSNAPLQEAPQLDWDKYHTGSNFQAPPPAIGPDNKPITYFGTPGAIKPETTDDGFRSYLIDPLVLVNSGSANGYTIRFTSVNVKKFINSKTGLPMEASSAGNFLRAAGISSRPQRNAEYDAAFAAVASSKRPVGFTIDWKAKDKVTGETIRGYENFPDDPQRPGQKLAVIKQGTVVKLTDNKGNVISTGPLQAEVMFANAVVRYYKDPSRKQ